MTISVEQLRDIMIQLENRKNRLESKDSYCEDVPTKYVGVAIYSDVINQLKGLVPID